MFVLSIERKRYDNDFKLKAVRTLLKSGRPVCEVADEFGLDFSMLYRWKNRYAKEVGISINGGNEKEHSQSEEIASLRKDINKMQESLDVLKNVLRKTLTNMCDFK